MHMNTRLLKAFSRGKMKISSHLVNFQKSIDVTSFTFFILDFLQETFPFTLDATIKQDDVNANAIDMHHYLLQELQI